MRIEVKRGKGKIFTTGIVGVDGFINCGFGIYQSPIFLRPCSKVLVSRDPAGTIFLHHQGDIQAVGQQHVTHKGTWA